MKNHWLEKYDSGGKMQEHQPNFNNSSVSIPQGFVGQGETIKNWKSPSWGGQFEDGGNVIGNRPTLKDVIRNNLQYFTGVPTNPKSKYKPTSSKNSNQTYFTYPELKSQVLNELTGSELGTNGKPNIMPKNFEGLYNIINNNIPIPGYPNDKSTTRRYMSSIGLGHYKVGAAEDEKGKYISAFDTFNWDLLPGKDYEFYDRIYKSDFDSIQNKKQNGGELKKLDQLTNFNTFGESKQNWLEQYK